MSQVLEDRLPRGTFFADLADDQLRAMELSRRIAESLVREHPEIANVYRDVENFQTLYQISQLYVPSKHSKNVARKAVGYAIECLISSDELVNLRDARKVRSLELQADGFDGEQFRERCRNAANRRHELGIVVDTDAMVTARGRTPWSNDEKQYALDLSNDLAYQHQEGQHKGRPDYELIALELNIQYHNCEEIRYTSSVAAFVRHTRRKK